MDLGFVLDLLSTLANDDLRVALLQVSCAMDMS
jgi:hypothetical protein